LPNPTSSSSSPNLFGLGRLVKREGFHPYSRRTEAEEGFVHVMHIGVRRIVVDFLGCYATCGEHGVGGGGPGPRKLRKFLLAPLVDSIPGHMLKKIREEIGDD